VSLIEAGSSFKASAEDTVAHFAGVFVRRPHPGTHGSIGNRLRATSPTNTIRRSGPGRPSPGRPLRAGSIWPDRRPAVRACAASAFFVFQSAIASAWSTLIVFCSLAISDVSTPNTLSPDPWRL
jgi:hypothetical protein